MGAAPVPGPDGFLLSPDDPLRAEHLRLNDYLLGEEQRSQQTPVDVAIWRKLAKRHFADQMQAVLRRLAAELLVAAVGLDDFREHIQIWFAPFRSGEALLLSVAGSHVIKGLIWFCAVAKDDELKECCLWLLDAKWKQKRNTEKIMVALGQFGIGNEELRARNLIKAPPPAPGPRLIEKMAKAMCLRSENHIQKDPDGELIVIQGQLHFYRLFRSTGRIERVSDHAELELNWPAIPDSDPAVSASRVRLSATARFSRAYANARRAVWDVLRSEVDLGVAGAL
jgi:hypothetical protein